VSGHFGFQVVGSGQVSDYFRFRIKSDWIGSDIRSSSVRLFQISNHIGSDRFLKSNQSLPSLTIFDSFALLPACLKSKKKIILARNIRPYKLSKISQFMQNYLYMYDVSVTCVY
jgi:hypothetical protein